MTNTISHKQSVTYWYPKQILNLFSPFKATTRIDFAVELLSRIAIAATVVFVGAMAVFLVRKFSARPNEVSNESIDKSSPQTPPPIDIKPAPSSSSKATSDSEKAAEFKNKIEGFDPKDPLWINFNDRDWISFIDDTEARTQVPVKDLNPAIYSFGIKLYIIAKQFVLSYERHKEFWNHLYTKAESDWMNPPMNIGENRWKYPKCKPLYFYIHITAHIMNLTGNHDRLGTNYGNNPAQAAQLFASLHYKFNPREKITNGLPNVLHLNGPKAFKDAMALAYSNWNNLQTP